MFVETDLAQEPRLSNLSGKTFLFFSAGSEEGSSALGPGRVLWFLSSSIERWLRNQELYRHLWDKVAVMAGPRCLFVSQRKGLLLAGSCRPGLLINACGPSVR